MSLEEDIMIMMGREQCLYQISPPEDYTYIEGAGYCQECLYDPEKNRECLLYSPVHTNYFKNDLRRRE